MVRLRPINRRLPEGRAAALVRRSARYAAQESHAPGHLTERCVTARPPALILRGQPVVDPAAQGSPHSNGRADRRGGVPAVWADGGGDAGGGGEALIK